MRALVFCALAFVGCRSGAGAGAGAGARADAGAGARASAGAEAEARAEAEAEAGAGAEAGAREEGLSLEGPGVATEWCIEGMRGLDEDACYVMPRERPGQLLVYLHGIVPEVRDSVQKQTVQRAVLETAKRAGAAAIVPRGRKGIGPEGAHDWWAWPTSPAAHAQLAKEIVLRWIVLKKKLEAIAGKPFERTYLAGSSNGAYFLSALLMRGDCDELGFPIDGYGVMSGGSAGGRGAGALAGRTARPVYVGFGTYDEETKRGARALGAVIEAAHWPVKIAEHPFGHGAKEVYLDEAFAFWTANADRR